MPFLWVNTDVSSHYGFHLGLVPMSGKGVQSTYQPPTLPLFVRDKQILALRVFAWND